MKRTVLPVLVAAICLFKSAAQIITFVQHPELPEKIPLLILAATVVIITLQAMAAYLTLKKPFLAFIVLIIVVVTHAVFFPLGAVISNEIVLGHNYWVGFMISALSNVLVALLAYAAWRVSRRTNKAGGVLERT
jgi:hypothetical protein